MKKLLTATLATAFVIGLSGCKSTPKTDSASDTGTSRANESTLEHIGKDVHTVGKGALDTVGAGVEAVGKAGAAGIDTFKSDKDKKSDHPDHPKKIDKKSDHPDHPDHPKKDKKSDHPDHPDHPDS